MSGLKEYDERLSRHDWYHAFSDHHATWRRGDAEYTALKKLRASSPEHEQLFDAWSKFKFSGPAWSEPEFSRGQLNAVRQQLGVIARVAVGPEGSIAQGVAS